MLAEQYILNPNESVQNIVWEDTQLSYIGKECQKIPLVLGNVYGKVAKRVDLSFNSLTSLNGLEAFVVLEELILDNNQIDDGVRLPCLSSVHTLSLNKNQINNLEIILNKILNAFPNLKYLSLLGNQACPDQLSNKEKDEEDYRRYRYYVIHRMPNLLFLDSTRIRSEERREAKRIGQYMKVVRPTDEAIRSRDVLDDDEDDEFNFFSPLPASVEGQQRAAYGKLKYLYTGKHSEGNRFITNHEL